MGGRKPVSSSVGGPDATRDVMGTIQSPRSGGGPIGLPMGEPSGLVPGGGRGKWMVPVTAKKGGVVRPTGGALSPRPFLTHGAVLNCGY